MEPFIEGRTRVLVCTDLASRGIDHDKVQQRPVVVLPVDSALSPASGDSCGAV